MIARPVRRGGARVAPRRGLLAPARRIAIGCLVALAAASGCVVPPPPPTTTGTISGTVVFDGGGALSGVTVAALRSSDEALIASTTTAADGSYSLALEPDTYRLRFSGTTVIGTLVTEHWLDQATFADATDLIVAAGAHATADASLAYTSTTSMLISGTVTNQSTGAAISGATVQLLRPDQTVYGSYTTPTNGRYTFPVNVVGTYFLKVSKSGYVTEYWQDQLTFATATPLTFIRGSRITADPVIVITTGTIQGRVVFDGTGQPAPYTKVEILRSSDGSVASTTTTGLDGTYSRSFVNPGSYRLRFSLAVATEHWVDSPTFAGGTDIVLAAGQTFTADASGALPGPGADCATANLVPGADLSGKDLSFCDLSGLDLSNAIFYNTNLHRADLTDANLTGAWFVRVTSGWVFDQQAITLDNFANLSLTRVTGANLTNAIVSAGQGRVLDLDWTGTNFTGVGLVGGANWWWWLNSAPNIAWYGDHLFEFASFDFGARDAVLRGTTLDAVYATDASFAGVDMRDLVCLGECLLQGVDLTDADLTGADLSDDSHGWETYANTTCPDGVVADGVVVTSCTGHWAP